MKRISRLGLKAKTACLARCAKVDIDACIDTDVDRAHLFIATSDVHLKYKLQMGVDEALEAAIRAIEYAKAHGFEVEFTCEDGTRTPLNRLIKFYKAAEEAGADIITVADTVGTTEPNAMFYLVSKIKESVKIPISVHCHNDFGLAVANTIAGVLAGAEQVHVTVNGLGERAGNASLEQVVMALTAFYGIKHNIKLNKLYEVSKLVEKYSMIKLPPNYPIVGENAFAHEAGIHVHGVLSNPISYEPIKPDLVGQRRRIVLGKHTGRHAIEFFLKTYFGRDISRDIILKVTEKVKELASKKKKVTEGDVIGIAKSILGISMLRENVKVKEFTVMTGSNISPTAIMKLEINGREVIVAEVGINTIDALIRAINKVFGNETIVKSYRLNVTTGDNDALYMVEVIVEDTKGRSIRGLAIHNDIAKATVEALSDAINKFYMGIIA